MGSDRIGCGTNTVQAKARPPKEVVQSRDEEAVALTRNKGNPLVLAPLPLLYQAKL